MLSKSKTVLLTREDLIKALNGCGRMYACAGEICPMFRSGGSNCNNDIKLLAAYMLEHDLSGLMWEQIEEVLHHGNT